MAKGTGYTPAKGPDGKASFTPKSKGGNKHGNSPRQDGKNSDKSVQAHDFESNHSNRHQDGGK